MRGLPKISLAAREGLMRRRQNAEAGRRPSQRLSPWFWKNIESGAEEAPGGGGHKTIKEGGLTGHRTGGQQSLEGPDPDLYLNGVLKATPQMKTSCSAPVTESALESQTALKKGRHGTDSDEPRDTQGTEPDTVCATSGEFHHCSVQKVLFHNFTGE